MKRRFDLFSLLVVLCAIVGIGIVGAMILYAADFIIGMVR